jgi:hypothetical protein
LQAYTKKLAKPALGMTVDPRLRFLITPALSAWSETMLQLPAMAAIGQLNMKQPGGRPNFCF